MHFKNGVLSEFRKVRSSERLDLLCSLLDVCLPFELRFLGTCLEFLGKRDFNELREDERQANNVNHISQFRSLTDENTRRKLVLYVSLLKSSKSDCVNYFSDVLASINMEEIGLVHGTLSNESSLEAMNKLMDELLLLYTIAVNHPAFTIHQKSKFAEILAQLHDEDKRLSGVRMSEKDSDVKFSDLCQQYDECEGVRESVDSLKLNDDALLDIALPDSNQGSVYTPLGCHISSTYSSLEAPSPTLSQGSSVSLGGHLPPPPACQGMVPTVSGHTTMTPPVPDHSKSASLELMSMGSMGDNPNQTSGVLPLPVQPPPSHLPPSGTVPSSTSPCLPLNPNINNASVGVPLGPGLLQGLINMPPDAVYMAYTGAPWNTMMIANPASSPSPTSGQGENNLSGGPVSTREGPPAGRGQDVVTPSSLSRQSSPTSSRAPTPPRKHQFHKGPAAYNHNPHHHHPGSLPLVQQTSQSAPTPHPAPPAGIVQPPVMNAPPIPQSVTNSPPPPAPPPSALPVHPLPNPPLHPQNCNDNWEGQHTTVKSDKEEHFQFLDNFQGFTPEELRHMSDEELRERGMPHEALLQLRSCVNKQHVSNGLPNREAEVHDSRTAWRFPGMDAALHQHLMPGQPYVLIPSAKPCRKSDSGCRQVNQQMQSVRIGDDRRPCSNGSSASDSSVGSRSPPDTPVLGPPASHRLWEQRGLQRTDITGGGTINENWPNSRAPLEEGLHEDGRLERLDQERNERTEWPERGDDRIRNYQPPPAQRNSLNRPRGPSKGNPPGFQTIPRGRVHHGLDKTRREAGPLNGEMNPPFPLTSPLNAGNNVPYTAPVSPFISHPGFHSMPSFHTFRPNYMAPNHPAYPYHHNGEVWSTYHQNPHPSHNFVRHVAAYQPAVPPPKLSCYNCGLQGHGGSDCKDLTFEEITQPGQFHLDYKPQKDSGDCSSDK